MANDQQLSASIFLLINRLKFGNGKSKKREKMCKRTPEFQLKKLPETFNSSFFRKILIFYVTFSALG